MRHDRSTFPAELEVGEILAGDLPTEPDLSLWFPVWGAPGLDAPDGPHPTA
jgi:hypothetical protein